MLQINSILVPRDFSSASDQALRHALDLARDTGATLHLLYATVLHEDPFAAVESKTGSPEAKIRERLAKAPDERPLANLVDGLEIETAVVRDIAAGPAILNYAGEQDIDVIVMGTHGRRGVRRMLLGSVAEEVVRRAGCPVLTVRGASEAGPADAVAVRSILVPIDFSIHSREALRYARELADHYDARMDLLHVIEERLPPAFYVGGVGSIYDVEPDIEEKARAKMKSFYLETGGPDVADVAYHAEPGQPPKHITDFAEEDETDMIVMSTHGLTGLDHFFMGSVAEKVIRRAPVPVFTVKAFGKKLVRIAASPAASQQK